MAFAKPCAYACSINFHTADLPCCPSRCPGQCNSSKSTYSVFNAASDWWTDDVNLSSS
eukprot:m.322157 g.322157  ORF g.322157 m.322157 type:complete len:58 (-) comp20346_c0_seq13:603-776(-)